MLPWRRFATALPSALVSRLTRPLPVSGRAVAVRARGASNFAWPIFHVPYADRNDEASKIARRGILLDVQSGSARPARGLSDYLILRFKNIDKEIAVASSWLRDACLCPQCVTPSSGQKTFHTHDLSWNSTVKSAEIVEQPGGKTTLRVVWKAFQQSLVYPGQEVSAAMERSCKEHVSEYDTQTLLHKLARLDTPDPAEQLPRRLWDRRTIERELKPVAYADWMADDNGANTEFYRALLDLYKLGILIVDGVPDSENAVREIANQIGNIQTTFYGELFDVVSKPNAENVAYTSEFLCLHQDLLYMDDPPYIQLLHCLRNDCDGGESLFSDSVRTAIEIQTSHPKYLSTLAKRFVRYHYERNGNYYQNSRPVFDVRVPYGTDPSITPMDGDVASIRTDYSKRRINITGWSPPFQATHSPSISLGPWDEDSRVVPHPMAKWITATKLFSSLVEHKDNLLEIKLQPGQCVLFNNRRVLHGRRQFNTTDGTRWLKGTYIADQTFHSRVTGMLRRSMHLPQDARDAESNETTPFGPVRWRLDDLVADEQEQVRAMLAAIKPA